MALLKIHSQTGFMKNMERTPGEIGMLLLPGYQDLLETIMQKSLSIDTVGQERGTYKKDSIGVYVTETLPRAIRNWSSSGTNS